jgi:hypothetical protein
MTQRGGRKGIERRENGMMPRRPWENYTTRVGDDAEGGRAGIAPRELGMTQRGPCGNCTARVGDDAEGAVRELYRAKKIA